MRKIIVFFFLLNLFNCARVESSHENGEKQIANQMLSGASPTPQSLPALTSLKPVKAEVRLSGRQREILDAALPLQVREILEGAETVQILAEELNIPQDETGLRTFRPTRTASVVSEAEKEAILEALYTEASSGEGAASCYEPHHGIKAAYKGQVVEIEICYTCAQFNVKSEFGKFQGTILREGRKSESLLNGIIQERGNQLN